MTSKYLPVGNEFVSIPKLNEANAAIEDISFLHMASRGMIELRGGDVLPLIAPFVEAAGGVLHPENLTWERKAFWVPAFTWQSVGFEMGGVILPPIGERGFAIQLSIKNTSPSASDFRPGLEGVWGSAWHCVNEDKRIDGAMAAYKSPWNDSVVFDMRCGLPLFSFAPMSSAPCETEFSEREDGIFYRLSHGTRLLPGETATVTFYWGFGFEEVAAATSAKEMLRQGFAAEMEKTLDWLEERKHTFEDKMLEALYNTNLFFCIFFSTGLTLDSEELVLVTSRSPRYYVSAAYWDRDSLLWSFPAILDADALLARQMLMYVFGRQRRNIGVHSRYIDGTVLEPGFELDELVAPVLALELYLDRTMDYTLLSDSDINRGLTDILRKLAAQKHSGVSLYSTFLQPTDDEIVHPYLTYDNVLVWKALKALSRLSPDWAHLGAYADDTRRAIFEHCVKTRDGKPFFAWSVDLEGNYDVYDEPPGSLMLLPHLGFCGADDEVWKNTARMIRSPEYEYSFHGCEFGDIGCAHAPHPWLLSVANGLLSGRVEESLSILRRAKMDNGIVCESIDEHTGECATGEAFATCAGFVCHALKKALKEAGA